MKRIPSATQITSAELRVRLIIAEANTSIGGNQSGCFTFKKIRAGAPLLIVLFSMLLLLPSCITDKELYQSAADGKELPGWRILSKAREKFGPYVQWKESLIRELIDGSRIMHTRVGPVEYAINGESGPYLMVMHGGPGGYDQTAALFGDMLGKGFRILSWSRPGYLRTPIEDGKTFEEQADVAAALMDGLGVEKAAVLGYSAGGPVAVYFAAKYPEHVWSLILECAVTQHWDISPENIQEKIYFGYLMYNDPFLWASDVVGRISPRLIGMSTIEMESSLDKDTAKKLMDDIMKDPRRVKVLTGMMKSMSPSDLRRDGMENDVKQLKKVKDLPLKKIKAPTLIIHGTDDADVPVADAALAANTIPHAELYLVHGGFHVMALTDKIDEITNKRIMFLKEHAPQ
ncbi:MAG TPA: alpha/beta hydrolase [Desulfomonilia bacterium]|nr:alpha/beta hydrolase [Desulfomonilia bacterium]